MITHLAPVHPLETVAREGRDEHPMRRVTREVALDGQWDNRRRGNVAALFDSMADQWHTSHDHPGRYLPLLDALDRGGVRSRHCVELGAGTGLGTRHLVERLDSVIATDLSMEMLAHLDSAWGRRVQLDAAQLPFPDASVQLFVLNNMLLFPAETDRVLAADGQIVWVNTAGEETPIHLTAEEVVAALPGPWRGVASRAGRGTWCVVERA